MMIKAGLIGLVIGFIYVMSITLISPFCTVCITPLLGISVGYLANRFDKPLKFEASLGGGAIAGAMTGCAALLGQILAAVVNGILVTNWEELPGLFRDMGFTQFPDSSEYWQTTLTANSMCGLLNLVLVAGLGAVGGAIWFQRHQHKKGLSAASV
jgi:MFS family permease